MIPELGQARVQQRAPSDPDPKEVSGSWIDLL